MDVKAIRRHRVAIVGGGFGGLFAAKRLGRAADVDVTVIDRTNHHLFQPLLYQRTSPRPSKPSGSTPSSAR